jgi:hypothetical protein
MRRLGLIAAFLLFLCVPARASVLLAPGSATSVNQDSVTSATINVSPHVDGQLLVWFTSLANGATPAVTGGGWTCNTQTGTYSGTICTRTASSEPASYTMTWTGSTSVGMMMLTVERTDGATPTIDQSSIVITASASSVNMPQVTTTGSGDLLLYFGSAFNGSAGATSFTQPGAVPFANAQYYRVIAGFLGQTAPGLTNGSINATAASTAAYAAATIAFNGAGSAVFVGHSGDVTSGGPTISVTVPPNTASGDALIVGIGGRGTTGYTITPPPDILKVLDASYVSNNSITLSSNIRTNDLITTYVSSNGTSLTAPASCGSNPWVLICSTNNGSFVEGWWSKVAETCDTTGSQTYTWTTGSGAAISYIDWRSFSGSTLSISAENCTVAPAAATASAPAITTTGPNQVVVPYAFQLVAGPTLTAPSNIILFSTFPDTNRSGGYRNQPTAGTTPTETFSSSNSSNAWLMVQFAIASANPSPFTAVGSSIIDPTQSVQLNFFESASLASGINNLPLSFIASTTSSLVADLTEWGNLNATTPVDTICPYASAGGTFGNIPSCTPSQADELFFGFQTHPNLGADVNSVGSPLIGILSSPDAENGYGASNLTQPSFTGGFNTPYASAKLGLDAATAPSRGTTNLRVNQEFLMLFSQYPIGQCNGCGGIGVTTP